MTIDQPRDRFWALCRVATLAVLGAVPACTAEPVADPGPGTDEPRPDGGVAAPTSCQGDVCGVPGADECCEGSVCVDFGDWGDVTCAMVTEQVADCATGCVLELEDGTPICSPVDYCETGGIWPEAMCARADSCDFYWEDEAACVDYVEGCLGARSDSDELAWMQAIATCTGYAACADFEACMWNTVGYCW